MAKSTNWKFSKKMQLGTKAKVVTTRKKPLPLELRPYKELRDLADTIFSKKVKTKHEKDGYCTCYTCGAWMINESNRNLHCGHFISRACHQLRWNFDNARPQCAQCNVWREGKKNEYEFKLRKELGDQRVDEMKIIGRNESEINREDLIEIIKTLKLLK